jgi:competence protein ComEA
MVLADSIAPQTPVESAVLSQPIFKEDSMLRLVPTIVAVALLLAALPSAAAAGQVKAGAPTVAKTTAPAVTVNINTASAAALEELPGIGAKTAARILDYRQKNGPFKKVEELMNVNGIGEKNFLKLKPQLTVGTAKADHDHHD